MKQITSTGDGMNVLIVCDYSPHHHWMTFATWYSFAKMLPDANVEISCNRLPVIWQMFDWARTCKVKLRIHQPLAKEEIIKSYSGPLIVVEPDVLMIREITDSELEFYRTPFAKSGKVWIVNDPTAEPVDVDVCCDVKEEKICTFVAYPNGWGKFVTSSWINKTSTPFQHRFGKGEMTSNEVKVEKLWKQLSPIFQTVSRG